MVRSSTTHKFIAFAPKLAMPAVFAKLSPYVFIDLDEVVAKPEVEESAQGDVVMSPKVDEVQGDVVMTQQGEEAQGDVEDAGAESSDAGQDAGAQSSDDSYDGDSNWEYERPLPVRDSRFTATPAGTGPPPPGAPTGALAKENVAIATI